MQITNCVGACSAGVADYKLCGCLYCWSGRLQTVWGSVLLEWQATNCVGVCTAGVAKLRGMHFKLMLCDCCVSLNGMQQQD